MKNKRMPTIHELLLDGRIIDRAMRRAVRGALLRHKRAGVPIVIRRSGEIVRVKPARIKVSPNGSKRFQAKRSSRSTKIPRASR